jgi:hypothetical protein
MPRPIGSAIACLTFLTIAPLSRVEAQFVGYGLTAGVSRSTFTGNLAKDARDYSGFIAGGFLRLGVAGILVEPGMFYTRKGAKSNTANNYVTNKLDYIQFPLEVKFHLSLVRGTKLYVGGGPAVGINIGCHYTTITAIGTTETACSKRVGQAAVATPQTEVSAIGEAGLEFGTLAIGLRGDFGLNNTYAQLASNPTNPDLKTRTLSVVATIRF